MNRMTWSAGDFSARTARTEFNSLKNSLLACFCVYSNNCYSFKWGFDRERLFMRPRRTSSDETMKISTESPCFSFASRVKFLTNVLLPMPGMLIGTSTVRLRDFVASTFFDASTTGSVYFVSFLA